jgi:hypothetical protein
MSRELLESWTGEGEPLTLAFLQGVLRVEIDTTEDELRKCQAKDNNHRNHLRIQLCKLVEAGRGVLTDSTLADLKTRLDELERLVKQGRRPIDEVLGEDDEEREKIKHSIKQAIANGNMLEGDGA